MKKLLAGLVVIGLATSLGCNQTPPGGPGTAHTGKTSVIGGGGTNDTFKLSLPTGTTSIKQGEKKEVTISIDRGKDFKQDVALHIKSPTDKLKVIAGDSKIKASDKEERVTLEAADDAPLGEHTIEVTGAPEKGAETSGSFTVKVTEKAK